MRQYPGHNETVAGHNRKAASCYQAAIRERGGSGTAHTPRLIAVADDATAATVITHLKAGKAFDELARQYSTAPSVERCDDSAIAFCRCESVPYNVYDSR